MNNRRNLVIVLGLGPFTPRTVFSQAKNSPVVIGWLSSAARGNNARHLETFAAAMAELVWKEGSDYVVQTRWSEGVRERLPSLAEELAQHRAAVILTTTASATFAATKAAPHTPIVQAGGCSPVLMGLAAGLARDLGPARELRADQ